MRLEQTPKNGTKTLSSKDREDWLDLFDNVSFIFKPYRSFDKL